MAPVGEIDTLIYLDIDGVLNLGIREDGGAPLLLNDSNLKLAMKSAKDSAFVKNNFAAVSKVRAVADRFPGLECPGSQQTSPLLLERLVRIIKAAGGRQHIVLASNWRQTKYAARVRRLEESLSKMMGSYFEFDGRTPLVDESSPSDRLRCIGEDLRRHCADLAHQQGTRRTLRVLILDDFFVNSLSGWTCGGMAMYSPRDIVSYMLKCASIVSHSLSVEVELVHCFEELTACNGLLVQVGRGLSEMDVSQAEAFFSRSIKVVVDAPPADQAEEMGVSERRTRSLRARQGICGSSSTKVLSALNKQQLAASVGICWAGILSHAPWLCVLH